MTVRVITSFSELVELSQRWAKLADAAGGRFYTQPFWCLAWWRHLRRGELHVIVVESQGELLALAPLRRIRVAGIDILRLIGSDLGPVSEILVAPGTKGVAAELWSYLSDQPRWMMDLRVYRPGGSALTTLRRSEGPPWAALLDSACPVVEVRGTLDEYIAQRPAALRQKLRRSEHLAVSENIRLRVEVAERHEEVSKLLPDLTSVFDAAELAHPRLHFLSGSYRAFTVEMLEQAAIASRLVLLVLYAGDRPAASAFGFRSGGALCVSGPRFHPEFGRFSPGHLVLRSLIEQAYKAGDSEVDLLLGDTRYKREWSTTSYETFHLTVGSSSGLHTLGRLWVTAGLSGRARLLARKTRNILTGNPHSHEPKTEGDQARGSGASD